MPHLKALFGLVLGPIFNPKLPPISPLTYLIRFGINGASRENGETKMSKIERPAAHIRHKGVFIDASFLKGSKGAIVEYYVVQGSCGRFYSLEVAKEIAEGIAARKAA